MTPTPAAAESEQHEFVTVQEKVYQQLRRAIVQGQLDPGHELTLRGLADMLGVSPMPVRDAIRRLVAERALQKHPNRRLTVPTMTPQKFSEICRARIALEPEAAVHALPGIDQHRLDLLIRLDEECGVAMAKGEVEQYMQKNQAFHFSLYDSVPQPAFMSMIESLWLQFGPFMRSVVGRWGTAHVIDQHEEALKAIKLGRPGALRKAIRADIMDGMRIIGEQALQDFPSG